MSEAKGSELCLFRVNPEKTLDRKAVDAGKPAQKGGPP